MNVTAEEFVDVETFAVEICKQRCTFLACCLQKAVDEKRAAGKLLNEQVTCRFACCNLLSSGNVLDQQSGFVGLELFEVKHVEQFEVALRVVCCLDDLTAQSGENEGKTSSSEHAQDLSSENNYTIQIVG